MSVAESPAAESSGEVRVPVRAEDVLDAAARLVRAFGTHDVDAYFGACAPEASFVFHNHPVRLESREDYCRLWRDWETRDGFRVLDCRSTNQRVQLFGRTAVFTHDVRTRVRSGGEEISSDERETIVFELRADRWLAVHEHLSPAEAVPRA